MKLKLLSSILACLILSFCATAPREKTWVISGMSEEYIESHYVAIGLQILTVENSTYDRVWEACENTLTGLGHRFYLSDKNSGKMRVMAITDAVIKFGDNKGTLRPTKSYTLSLLISEIDGSISVQASALKPNEWKIRGTLEMNILKNEIDKVMRAIKKKLKIKQ